MCDMSLGGPFTLDKRRISAIHIDKIRNRRFFVIIFCSRLKMNHGIQINLDLESHRSISLCFPN